MPAPAMGPASRRRALLALSSPLLILLALVALLVRPAGERLQALPALGIGVGLLVTSWQRRRHRRRELLRALRDDGRHGEKG
ncbi:MAG: DUF3188 domain-containing protein [Synechococcus sp. ELA057]|jgi:hypothetical protein